MGDQQDSEVEGKEDPSGPEKDDGGRERDMMRRQGGYATGEMTKER